MPFRTTRWRLRQALCEDASEFILQWCAFRDHLEPAKVDVLDKLLVTRIATSGRQYLLSLTPVKRGAGFMFSDESGDEPWCGRRQCQEYTRVRLGDVELQQGGCIPVTHSAAFLPQVVHEFLKRHARLARVGSRPQLSEFSKPDLSVTQDRCLRVWGEAETLLQPRQQRPLILRRQVGNG